MTKKTIAATAAAALMASSCASMQTNEIMGALGGAAAGGIACALSGANTTECALLVAGGALAGYGLAKFLDARDRAAYDLAVQEALTLSDADFTDKRSVTQVSAETNNTLTYTPISVTQQSGLNCRVYNVDYVKAGEAIVQQETYCQQPDGSWKPSTSST